MLHGLAKKAKILCEATSHTVPEQGQLRRKIQHEKEISSNVRLPVHGTGPAANNGTGGKH